MIAPIRLAQLDHVVDQAETTTPHDRFVAMLPKIRQQARLAFRGMNSEFREELLQETVANAYCAFARLARRGKEDLAFATPLAQYAIRQIKAGRRVGGRLNVRDITSRHAQLAHDISIKRLDRYDSRKGVWMEILVEDRHATPADTAAARIDVAAWFASLPRRERKIAKLLATGETTGQAAKRFAVSDARISQLRRELQESWEEFQGLPAAA